MRKFRYYLTLAIPRIDTTDRYYILRWFGYEAVISR